MKVSVLISELVNLKESLGDLDVIIDFAEVNVSDDNVTGFQLIQQIAGLGNNTSNDTIVLHTLPR